MGPKKCQVCEESQSKYKCPICLIPYCSLGCFKKHKEAPCSKPETLTLRSTKPETLTEEKIDSCLAINDDKPCYVDDPSEVLQQSQLQSIASYNEICDAIKDEKLQKLIYGIDSSADADNELDKAMENDEFRLFTEKILSSINP